MNRAVTGWLFVAAQVLLLASLILLPGSDHWPTPAWVNTLGMTLVAAGLLVVLVASLRLGAALTPTPVPNDRGPLTTTGLYGFVRHPIYSGILTAVIGLTVGSGSVVVLVVALVTIGFFHTKAAWEEEQLALHHPDYAAYAARTPRFVPRLR